MRQTWSRRSWTCTPQPAKAADEYILADIRVTDLAFGSRTTKTPCPDWFCSTHRAGLEPETNNGRPEVSSRAHYASTQAEAGGFGTASPLSVTC